MSIAASARGHAQPSSHNERSVAASSIREVASSMRGNIERGYRRCVNWTRSLPVLRTRTSGDKRTAIQSLRTCAKNMKDACDKELQNATDNLSSALGEKFNSVLIEAESACNSGDSTLDLMPRFLEVVDEYNGVIAAINAIEVPQGHKQASPQGHKQASPQSSATQLNRDVAELKRAFQKLEASSVEREHHLQDENRRLAEQVAEMQRQISELVKQRSVSARSTIDSRRRRDSERSDIEVIPHDACRSGHDDTLSIERISINDA